MTPNRINELDPPPRLLMGPGPVDVDPRILKAMSMPMLGQFDPAFTEYMNQTMAVYRQVFRTENHWSLLVNGTARAGIEACMTSLIAPGDRVLVPIFGRFGHLLTEIAKRCGAEVINIEAEWGQVFRPDQIADALPQDDQAAEELYPNWRKNFERWEKTGSDFGYHYLGSAIWFNRIGKAFGAAMLELIDARASKQ